MLSLVSGGPILSLASRWFRLLQKKESKDCKAKPVTIAVRRDANYFATTTDSMIMVSRFIRQRIDQLRSIRWRLSKQLQLPAGYFFDVGGKVEGQERAARSLTVAIGVALFAVFLLLYLALDSTAEAVLILVTIPVAFVGSIIALLVSGETWNVSSLVGPIRLFVIAVQNGLVLVTQTRTLTAEGKPLREAIREASLGRVRPKLMTASTAICGLLPILLLRMHGTEIERPLAIGMTGGLVTSTIFILLVQPTIYPDYATR
jgi:cobalt-zinc-cadmium resistance protein CzcA